MQQPDQVNVPVVFHLVVQAADNGNLAQVRDYLTTDFPAWLVQHAESMDTVTMMSYRTYLNSKQSQVAC